MDETLQELGEYVAASLAPAPIDVEIAHGELILGVQAADILSLLQRLKTDPRCQFQILVDICGVDYPDRPKRFDVVYNLLSLKLNHRVRVKVATDEATPVPSSVGVYSAAGWFEREAWDLYGILFSDHPDLRRILTDYGFEGHPQRKDFPLTGYVQVRYDEEQKRVVNEPVRLVQEFRIFDFVSPWEGMVLPGDEKAAAQTGSDKAASPFGSGKATSPPGDKAGGKA
jgi:NADH-quinone oxidoreductase subunit C